MSHATLDRVLAVLVIALAATGLLSLRAGAPADGWVFVLHGLLGGALAAATVVKLRRSTPRAVRASTLGSARAGAARDASPRSPRSSAGSPGSPRGRLLSIGSWTVLTLHAWVGLALVPLVPVHLVPRRWRLLRPPAASPVRLGAVAAGGAGGGRAGGGGRGGVRRGGVGERLLGGMRRFTGSRWLPAGGIPPVTTFFGEATPADRPGCVAADRPRRGRSDVAALRPELRSLGSRITRVVLDCTSGWAMETALARCAAVGGRRASRRTARPRHLGHRLVDESSPRTRPIGRVLAIGVAGADLPRGQRCPVPARRPGSPRRGLGEVGDRHPRRLTACRHTS